MNNEKFMVEIGRLIDVFGGKNLSEAKILAIWDRVKTYDIELFTAAVTHVIVEDLKPTLSTLMAHMGVGGATMSPKSETKHYDCSHCGQGGIVYTNHKTTSREVLFKCKCDFGRERTSYPEWNSVRLHEVNPNFYDDRVSPSSDPVKLWHKGFEPAPKVDYAARKAGE